MPAGRWESTREAFEWHEAKPSAFLASRLLSQLPKCIHNLIDAQIKHGPFLLEHCHFKRKLIKYGILLSHFGRFDWLNAITRFERCTGVRLSRFRCTLAPYKKRAKNCQLCSKTRRLVLKKTVFLRGRVCWIWVWSTKVDMVCLSPVGYGV